MTRAVAVYWPDTGECSLQMRGHATGSEQICAAASGIVYALAGYLQNDPAVEIRTCWLDSGDATLNWKGGRDAMGAFRMTCVGLMQLERADPDRIQTKISENIFTH